MPLPVITVAQMREWEKATWASGQTELAVMRRAGDFIARKAEYLTRPGDLILVLAGKGHNGDDATFASEQISNREVHLIRVSEPQTVGVTLKSILERPVALIIDGLFGIGLNRALASSWLKLIQQLNEAGAPILSVDVPSGISADTGEPLDDAIRATHTITFGAVKHGLVRSTGWPFVGRLDVAADIGLLPYPFESELNWTIQDDFTTFRKARAASGHKGAFGHVAIVAGSRGYHGAGVLAARGAQRAQPGLVTLITAEDIYEPVAAQLQAVMVQTWGPSLVLPENCTTLVVGPGLAAPNVPDSLRSAVAKLWKESRLPILADASALAWLPVGDFPPLATRVLTPHPGEAARMLKGSIPGILQDRPNTLRQLSKTWGGCYVVLKSHQTLIGRHREELYINSSGNPELAQGGSGDLLAGFLGGLMAQPAYRDRVSQTLRYGVWQHGAAADSLAVSHPAWTIEDLAAALGSVRPRPGH